MPDWMDPPIDPNKRLSRRPDTGSFKGSFRDPGDDSVLAIERKTHALRAVRSEGIFAGTEFAAEESEHKGPDILKGRASYSESSRAETAKLGAALLKQSMGAVGAEHVKP